MILRNWMVKDPETTSSDTLVSEALKVLLEKNLRAMPVVDQGVLRGLVTRKDLQGCAADVARVQDRHENEYFMDRLKVKDVMIRRPNTVDAGDTVEHCMLKGQQELIRNYPVLENGRLVGLVSSYELFEALSQVLGADEVWCGITLEPVLIDKDTLVKVASIMEKAGAVLHGLLTMRLPETNKKRIIVRFDSQEVERAVEALESAGYKVWEVRQEVQSCIRENNAADH